MELSDSITIRSELSDSITMRLAKFMVLMRSGIKKFDDNELFLCNVWYVRKLKRSLLFISMFGDYIIALELNVRC